MSYYTKFTYWCNSKLSLHNREEGTTDDLSGTRLEGVNGVTKGLS